MKRCRDWYREAVCQIMKHIDISDPALNAMEDIGPSTIPSSNASQAAAGIRARQLPRLKGATSLQEIDRQWRSIMIDDIVTEGPWENASVVEFWKGMQALSEYRDLALFMLQIIALLQSTAAVEHTFLKINNNKTKLRNSFAISTIKSIVKASEKFKEPFEIDERLFHLHSKARNSYMQKYTETDRINVEDNVNFE